MPPNIENTFMSECRRWRAHRKLSQLDLALLADISQRHLSYLETGRSQPSREMVVRLATALDLPLRKRNTLLKTAGFAALYTESNVDEPIMAPVLEALNRMLSHHDPLPAIVVDRFWNVKQQNRAADMLFRAVGAQQIGEDTSTANEINLAWLTLHPQGFRKYIVNWERAAPMYIHRLKSEALASGDIEVQAKYAEYIALAGDVYDSETVSENLLPVLPLELKIGDLELSLFTVISTFGTPQDVTTDELRIEAFYPTDAKTEAFFKSQF